ncbi:splicing factor U2af large subunit B-like isoform X3 [Pyrus x bretschneideri]|uniref:splicing factor U2af large subunit B-like isoform X3 n=1 Tax=Pyrus x bretschneideri TaxID=225117 RepID=UPI00203032AF|nr:splicing factor U2af large subunit B-like isoform X3 [Pyrus x bretschneideri]
MSDYEGVSKHSSRGSERESSWRDRQRDRGQDRAKDGDRYTPEYKDKSGRFDRGRNSYDGHLCGRNQDFDRHRHYDQDRERMHRHRSRSRSRSRSMDRSPSRSCSKSKRTSGFDMAPPAGSVLYNASVSAGQLSGIPQTMPGVVQNSFPFGALHMALPLMPAQAMTQQATRHARWVYVGGLPPLANEQTIATFFSQVMAAIGRNSVGSISELAGDAVVNVYINHEKKFAFVEMRTVEEASNAMALDGIIFEGVAVRVRRPTDYNPTLAATLGPSQPSPHLNLAAIRLTQGAVGGVEGPDRIFVGGLPYYFTEAQIRELLQSFGPLRGFDLVKDNDTGNSKGYGFCVYQDPTVTDVACGALNGLKMGDKTLTVRRASASNGQSKTEQENILVQAQQHLAMQKMAMRVVDLNLLGAGMATMASGETPTKVLCLTEAITADQLGDDEEYVEILEDMRDECSKFGTLVNVVIPRADQGGEQIPGVGKVFLEYTDIGGCANAKNVLGGRKFGGNTVNAVYYPEEKYYIRDYSA